MTDSELEFLKESLIGGEVIVKFTKVDGTERHMLCTKQPDLIPEDKVPSETRPDLVDCIRVFDLEKNDWRAFKPSAVIDWSPVC